MTPEQWDMFPEFRSIGLRVGDEIPVGFTWDTNEGEPKKPEPVQAVEEPVAPSRPKPTGATFRGQIIISDGMRTVNEKTYHSIRIGDGSMYDLTDAEYAAQVTLPA